MPTPPNITTITIEFTEDTPVNVEHVGREHIGRIRHRPANATNPQNGSRQETYFAKGTVITIPDYLASGTAVAVQPINNTGLGEVDHDPETH